MPKLMNSKPTPVAENLTAYQPALVGDQVRIKLDANEGKCPAIDLSQLSAGTLSSYPDKSKLEKQIADRYNVDADQVIVTAGGDDAIDRVLRAFLDDRRNLVFPEPSFEMIRKYAAMRGAEVRPVPWSDTFPVDAILESADGNTGVVSIVSPNNPTGGTVSNEDVYKIAEALPAAILLVDQAYAEFEDTSEESLTRFCLDNLTNTIGIRTFSKAWGLASLRVGYAIGNSEAIEQLRCVGGPFPVSGMSLNAASMALCRGYEQMKGHVEQTINCREQLIQLLNDLGQKCRPSQGNFVYLEFCDSNLQSDIVYNALLAQGILVRNFPNQNALRITCPIDESEYQELERVLRCVFAPQAILFDMDGVLVDEAPSYRKAIQRTCESFGLSVSVEEISRLKLGGNANNDWVFTQRLLQENGVTCEFETVKDRFEELLQGTQQSPGLWQYEVSLVDVHWIRELATRLPLGVVTGRPRRDAMRFLENLKIAECFEAVVCMEDGPAKPNPTNVQAAMQQLSVSRAWMIGDTQDDARAAIGAGAIAFGVVAPSDAPAFSSKNLLKAGAATVVDSLEQFGALLP